MERYRLRRQKRYQLRGRETRTRDISPWSFPLWQVVHFISFILKTVSWNSVQTKASPGLWDLETWQECDMVFLRELSEVNPSEAGLHAHALTVLAGSVWKPGESAEPHWAQRKISGEWPVSHKSSQSDPQLHVSSPSPFSKCLRRDLWLLLVWVISCPYLDSALEIMWPTPH